MGYFIQISNDSGRPIFQAVKNYPDVSFASSALFHALVTASLEQGFVPSVLRAEDASIALAVHGPHGARLGLALVTSEIATGRTADVDARLRWRLDALHQGALLAVGQEVLKRAASGQVQADAIRRVLAERLSPIVSQLMADEVDEDADSSEVPEVEGLEGFCPRLPNLGLRVCGTAVEWLAVGCSATAERALADLLEKAPGPADCRAAVLSWNGRVLAATPAWQRLAHLDRGLLVAMADGVGPATFGKPLRTLALEEVDDLWPRIRKPGLWPEKNVTTGMNNEEEQVRPRHRMVSVRLYPDSDRAADPRHREDASLVLSLLQEVGDSKQRSAGDAQKLAESVARCAAPGGSLQNLWRRLLMRSSAGCAQQLLGSEADCLRAAILMDGRCGDVVALPAPWCMADLKHNDNRVSAFRRLLYWIHALPTLDANCEQQFVCSEGYFVAGARRDDDIICWGLAERPQKRAEKASEQRPETKIEGPPPLVLQSVLRLLRRLPRAGDLWSSLGALEPPEPAEKAGE